MEDCQGNKTTIEKMMNLYELNDFFHINRKEDEEDIQLRALGEVLKQFWSMTFKLNYPNRNILVAQILKSMKIQNLFTNSSNSNRFI